MYSASLPILYSLRQCPYCIRTRLCLLLAEQQVLLREISTKNKPEEMLAISPKGTVPILELRDTNIIDESVDIMFWALQQNDPNNLLLDGKPKTIQDMRDFIAYFDDEFVDALKKYKAAVRYRDNREIEFRQVCETFIRKLEQLLSQHSYLMGNTPCLTDYALLPFIRQFSRIDRKWYANAPYPLLRQWLSNHYNHSLYAKAMVQFPRWLENRESFVFGES